MRREARLSQVMMLLSVSWVLLLLLQTTLAKKKAKNFRVSSEITTGWTFCRNEALYYGDFLYKTTVINTGLFWNFIREISSGKKIDSQERDREELNKVLGKHVSARSELARLLKINVEMEYSAARMEAIAHAQAEKEFPACNTFIEYGKGKFVCSVDQLQEKELGPGNLAVDSFDYIYSVERKLPLIRLYTVPGAEEFVDIFNELKGFADEEIFSLVLQFVPKPKECPFYEAEVQPTGYGLEFEMKSAQYVVEEPLLETQYEPSIKVDSVLEPFSKIGKVETVLAKAIEAIKRSPNKLMNFAQDLAWRAEDVKSTPAPSAEILEAFKAIDHQTDRYRINGFDMASSNVDPFRLIDFMNLFYGRELELQELGYRGGMLKALIRSRYNPEYAEDVQQSFAIKSKAIIYLNDLEKDQRYQAYPKSFNDYERVLQQPGLFLAKNIVTVIVPLKLSSPHEAASLVENVVQLIGAGFPLRFGILPIGDDERSQAITNYFYAVQQKKGLRACLSFLKAALIAEGDVKGIISELLQQLSIKISEEDSHNAEQMTAKALQLAKSFSIRDSTSFFANGQPVKLTQNIPQVLLEMYRRELQLLAKEASDSTADLYDFILKQRKAVDHRNDLFTDPHLRYNDDKYFTVADIRKLLAFKHYAYNDAETAEHSLWIAGEFSRQESFQLALQGLNQSHVNSEIRARVFCLSPMTSVPNRIIVAASGVLSESPESLDIVVKFLEVFYQHYFNGGFERGSDLERLAKKIQKNPVSLKILQYANDLDSPVLEPILKENDLFFDLYELEWRKKTFIAINSNAWKLKDSQAVDIAQDMDLFVDRELTRRGARHAQLARDLGHTRIKDHLLVFGMVERKLMAQVDVSLSHFLTPGSDAFPDFGNEIVIGDAETSIYHVSALFNPFTKQGQKFASIINYLATTDMFSFALQLMTDPEADDPKSLKIYRFVTPEYKDTPIPIAPVADEETLLAMNLDLPAAWMLVTEEANADLDNIRPTKTPHLKVRFRLKYLLIEGQAVYEDGQNVAVGKIVEAYDAETGLFSDQTTVMANYGYFQLKASPGRWNLRVVDEAKEYPIEDGSRVQITSFGGAYANLEIEREGVPFSAIKFRRPQADINVFSLASGLFYERLLRIMIRSVIKQAGSSTVKFWLLETTLSPQGKEALEKMASHYGFEYELMSYKWPFWLNAQTRKHRTIWAYKVLFLDVLFPLNLKRVIFVDADQVVRSSLKELMDLDLKGHVYAMTPFCNDKAEMADYRFWEHNYWKNHLRGRPYHISALFVVDLELLRRQQVTDILRAQYQALSRDPNSLANLDQDLPNNLQHAIPIFSLPQEWLWCETWCMAENKARAKTIDLCNNPKTFESKYEQAKRIIPEWKEYDEEITSLLTSEPAETIDREEL